MFKTIPPLPEIPDGLRLAAREGRLVPFIGAGASRLAKCPSWDEFANALLAQLVEYGALNFSQAQQIQDQYLPPRIKLSFVRNIAKQKGIPLDYEAIIHSRRDLSNVDGRRLYGALGRLCKAFVTTNYDYWLDSNLSLTALTVNEDGKPESGPRDTERSNVIYKKSDISFAQLHTPGTVIHLHGSLRNPESMVVTTGDYLDYYRNATSSRTGDEENHVLTFLRALFNEKVILFIGYGMADLEILEYVILKSQARASRAKHYILQLFFSHELEIANIYEGYYSEDCNLELMPYLRDGRDHLQLVEVVENLANLIPANNVLDVQRRAEMEALLND